MHKNIAIKVQNLTKTYKLYDNPLDRFKESLHPLKKKYHKEFSSLDNMNFEIKKGETVGIIGKNGSGKSTLLKIITGVLNPSSGRATVHGRISAILELGAGFNPEMTGLENIYLNMSINGLSKKETDKKIDDIVEFAELDEFIYQPIKTYSSGMKARLAFAVSINVEPDILIVDEALSVGDVAFQRKCFAKIESIRERGATILFVSHSEASIVSICNRAIWISNGEKIIDGRPKLVTGLYMKNANKKQVEKASIQKEYESLLKNKEGSSKITKENDSNLNTQSTTNIEEYYNPSLKPKSTIYYEENGAKISDVKITTVDGKKVNILIQGKQYIYSYKFTPEKKLQNVKCGFLIKRKDGVILGGGAYPSKNTYIKTLSTKQQINFIFTCSLNNGEYFLNCGVLSDIDNTNDYVHKIVDAYMIKVINANEQITGYVNFIDNIVIKETK